MTERETEARKADVIERIQRLEADGKPLTVRSVGHAFYSKARRLFGSWSAAIEAAGGDPVGHGPTELFKNLDAVSASPLPGLPAFMRERQILGGRILEHLARSCQDRPDVIANADDLVEPLLDAFYDSLREWHLRDRQPVYGATALLSSGYGTHAVEQTYAPGETTGDVEL
jgi:hypothetical protein